MHLYLNECSKLETRLLLSEPYQNIGMHFLTLPRHTTRLQR